MFCPNCGLTNDAGVKFCSNCGHSFFNEVPKSPQSNEPLDPAVEQPKNTFVEQPTNEQSQPSNNQFFQPPGSEPFQQPSNSQFQITNNSYTNHSQEGKKNRKLWIISIVVVLLLVGLFAGGYLLYSNLFGLNGNLGNNTNIQDVLLDKNQKGSKEEKEKEVIEEKEKTQIIKESMPKVFTILTEDSLGSGFLYKDGGYIVTNAHVVAGYTDVLVRNSAGQEYPGRVIGISDTSDIALIYCENYEETEPLPMEMNTSDIGIEVIAIGSPQGFENSATFGYLTGTNRVMHIEGLNFVYDELYQIDAQIDQGSSGGPLFDATTGKVIGINSLIYTENETFGFAIPLYSVSAQFDTWIDNPMTPEEVIAVNVYVDYANSNSQNDLGEDYSEFWQWYEQYYGTNNYDDFYNDYQNTYSNYFDEESLLSFITSFFEYYEWSINDGDFYWIQDMISTESNAYYELEDQISTYYEANMTFDYWYTEITGINIFDGYAIVTTYEEYDLYDVSGEYTTYFETVEYYITIDDNGYYVISDIYYTEAQ
ncbi:trypsin-like peptidase domain-containing protein [Ureibacillus massiliensis]|uniref:trypsin-like peptidase domain-containing protein n=1 Tax=Ureibacillus massiliensis TaxID=292806 RepID=UPI0006902CC3|nr:trypsin-like peptidase domain-containing protein [Ureibacillus massiliensis]